MWKWIKRHIFHIPEKKRLHRGFDDTAWRDITHLSYSFIDILDGYIALAEEANAPLLPIAQEIRTKLPDLARRYRVAQELYYHGTASETKKEVYGDEVRRISTEIEDAKKIFSVEKERLEIVYGIALVNGARESLHEIGGEYSIQDELKRARLESSSMAEVELISPGPPAPLS